MGSLLPFPFNDHPGRRETSPEDFLHLNVNGGEVQFLQFPPEGCRAQPGIDQGSEDHVAACTGKTVKIGNLHLYPHGILVLRQLSKRKKTKSTELSLRFDLGLNSNDRNPSEGVKKMN